MKQLVLTNTLSGKKEVFAKKQHESVTMYVCGITTYDYAHIGHGRVYVTFDVLYRLLKSLGYQVKYYRNFTDIDDKIIARAEREYNDPLQYHVVAQRFIDAYLNDMKLLGNTDVFAMPRVTETMPEILAFIQNLINAGHAYQVAHDVYFSVENFPEYGKLSRRTLDGMQPGARIAVRAEKAHPADFALWKGENSGPLWQSPWGTGRPGWHIECSAMIKKYIGDQVDIHGGGMDLTFPHHENEKAQTESLTQKPIARFWVHNAFVRIDQEKMSKSLGNFITLRDLFAEYEPMVVRYMFLNHQYRNPLDFSYDDLQVAQKGYQRLINLLHADQRAGDSQTGDPAHPECAQRVSKEKGVVADKMQAFLLDDLNTPGLLGVVFEHAELIKNNEHERAAVARVLTDILGLSLQKLPEKQQIVTPEIQALLDAREQARSAKEWARADVLREQLRVLEFEVRDSK